MSIEKIICGLRANLLKNIDLSSTKLTPHEFNKFLDAFKKNESIRTLTMNLSHYGFEQLTLLIDAIKHHVYIQNFTAICKKDIKAIMLEHAFKSHKKLNLKINVLSKGDFGFFKTINTITNQEVESNLRSESHNNQSRPNLPSDVMTYIFNMLNGQDLLKVANTSKKWALKLSYYYYKYNGQDTIAAQLYDYIQSGNLPININRLFKNTLMKDFFLLQKAKLTKKIEAIPMTTHWEEIYKPIEIPITVPLNKSDEIKLEKYQKRLIEINLNINRLSDTIQHIRHQL